MHNSTLFKYVRMDMVEYIGGGLLFLGIDWTFSIEN